MEQFESMQRNVMLRTNSSTDWLVRVVLCCSIVLVGCELYILARL